MAKKLGERLVEAGLVTAQAIDQALQQQKITGHKLGDCLVEIGLIKETDLLRFLATDLNTRFVSADKLSKAKIEPSVLDKLPVRVAEQQNVLPLMIDLERKIISVVMAEPQNEALKKEIALVTEMDEVYAFVALRSAIQASIKKYYYGDPTAFQNLNSPSQVRSDVSALSAAAENTSGGVANPALKLDLTNASRIVRPGTQISRNPTQLREALGAVRGTVGDNDYVETLNILVSLLEMGRKDMRGHSAQLARQSQVVAKRMGLPPRDVNFVGIACFLHDLGKPRERHFVLSNYLVSGDWKGDTKRFSRGPIKLFETVNLPPPVNTILAQLFEAFDGSGVPMGAKGEDIHPGARVIAAVDAFLDLTKNANNAHARIFTKEEALEHLSEQTGKLYDPVVVDLIQQLQSGEMLAQRLQNEGRQILIAEPDEAVRTDMLETLGKKGLTAHTVPSLEGVAESLLSGESDALVVGLRFGEKELLTLLSYVRSLPETAGAPVVILGEPPDVQARERLMQTGASALVPMPLDPDKAADTVHQLFIARINHGAPAHPVRGSFDELSMLEILRVLASGRKSGRLVVRHEAKSGYLQLERGRIVFAAYDQQSSEAALKAILGVKLGDFAYEPDSLLMDMPHLDKDLNVVVKQLSEGSGVTAQPAA
ncbi:MAG: HD domain-containing phosphohydrolase [Myxococcaceae bacterium]